MGVYQNILEDGYHFGSDNSPRPVGDEGYSDYLVARDLPFPDDEIQPKFVQKCAASGCPEFIYLDNNSAADSYHGR